MENFNLKVSVLLNSLKILFQYILPKQLLTYLIGWGANKEAGWITKLLIDLFIKYYKINMKEAKNSNTANYRNFNDFFTRALRDDVRLINKNPNILVMPADGIVRQFGNIEKNQVLQAKNHQYSLESLLAANELMIKQFYNGTFITIYISPQNYHRVHMPCNGTLRTMIYVPGTLFSVNHFTVQNIPNIFARNERVICLFDTPFGPMVQILIGAIIVGSIETTWIGTITPPRTGIIKSWTWPIKNHENSITLAKGQEMGRFKMGSTVINLFAPKKIKFFKQVFNSSITKIGEPMALSNSEYNQNIIFNE